MAAAGLAVGVLGVNLIVRLIVWPARQDAFIGQLLDQLAEPCTEDETTSDVLDAVEPAFDLQESLLRHFERSTTSQQILGTLVRHDGLTDKQLQAALDRAPADKGRPKLPLPVTRRVAAILRSAGLVALDQGVLRITELGRQLHSLLSRRGEARVQELA